jgi:hypothetical protein
MSYLRWGDEGAISMFCGFSALVAGLLGLVVAAACLAGNPFGGEIFYRTEIAVGTETTTTKRDIVPSPVLMAILVVGTLIGIFGALFGKHFEEAATTCMHGLVVCALARVGMLVVIVSTGY